MTRRSRLLLIALLVLAGISLLLNMLAREPAVTERSLVSASSTRNVVDLVQAPLSADLQFGGHAMALPEPTGRWLVCTLDKDLLRIGWVDDLAAEAVNTVDLPAQGAVRVAAWPVRQEPDAVGVELAYGWTPDAQRVTGRITVRLP